MVLSTLELELNEYKNTTIQKLQDDFEQLKTTQDEKYLKCRESFKEELMLKKEDTISKYSIQKISWAKREASSLLQIASKHKKEELITQLFEEYKSKFESIVINVLSQAQLILGVDSDMIKVKCSTYNTSLFKKMFKTSQIIVDNTNTLKECEFVVTSGLELVRFNLYDEIANVVKRNI